MKTYELYTGRRGDGSREKSADDIERDLGSIRSEMSSTLRAIEAKLSGGDVMGQIVSQLRGEGAESGELLRNAAAVARANPIPVALIATGIGAILLAGSEGTSGMSARVKQRAREKAERYRTEREFRSEGEEGSDMSQRARETASQVGERARDVRHGAQERLQHAREGARDRLQHAREGAGRRVDASRDMARERAQQARERAQQARELVQQRSQRAREGLQTVSHQGRRVIEDEPLVVVGLGLAVGAAIAASIPLMSEARERSRRARIERERYGEQQQESQASAGTIEEVQVASETSTGIEWTEEPQVGPDVISRPEYPEDDSTTYR